MADLNCAIVESGVVVARILCCGGDPATCRLHPVRLGDADRGVAIGWLRGDDGSFAAPPVAVVVPVSITKHQFMLQAKASGLWTMVKAALDASQDAQDEYDATSVIARNYALLTALAKANGMDDAAVDAFFVAASTL